MKNSKNKKLFTYMVVGALVMALSISCKSNEEPTGNTHSNHPPAGNYKNPSGETATVTIKDGGCNITGKAFNSGNTKQQEYNVTITKWYRGDGSDINSFRAGGDGEGTVTTPSDNAYFYVFYYVSTGIISLSFEYNGVMYGTLGLEKVN